MLKIRAHARIKFYSNYYSKFYSNKVLLELFCKSNGKIYSRYNLSHKSNDIKYKCSHLLVDSVSLRSRHWRCSKQNVFLKTVAASTT